MKKVRVGSITSIEIVENELCEYIYKPKKKFLGITIQEEGLYFYRYLIHSSIPSNVYISEDGVAYMKPYVLISLNNGEEITKYFEHKLHAIQFVAGIEDAIRLKESNAMVSFFDSINLNK